MDLLGWANQNATLRRGGSEPDEGAVTGYQDVAVQEPQRAAAVDDLPGFEQRTLSFDEVDLKSQQLAPPEQRLTEKGSRMTGKKRGRPFKTAASGNGTGVLQKEFEGKLATAASEYRSKHFKGAAAGRVRWNQDGSGEVIGIARQAAREVPGLNRKALADAAEVAYGTLNKWIETGDAGESKKMASRTLAARTEEAPAAPKRPTGQVTFDIVKLESGGFRVSIDPSDIKTFIQSI